MIIDHFTIWSLCIKSLRKTYAFNSLMELLGRANIMNTMVNKQTLENHHLGLKGGNVEILKKGTTNVIKSNKCNQCDYASSNRDQLRNNLKAHNGERLNKCNQCNFVFSQTSTFENRLWKTKHRKNCECCPVSLFIVRQQRLSWIQDLNCRNCNQCLKCHKSLGSLFEGAL